MLRGIVLCMVGAWFTGLAFGLMAVPDGLLVTSALIGVGGGCFIVVGLSCLRHSRVLKSTHELDKLARDSAHWRDKFGHERRVRRLKEAEIKRLKRTQL